LSIAISPANPKRVRFPRAPFLRLLGFARLYRWRIALAVLTLLISTGAVLAFGQVIRAVVDSGLGAGSGAALDRSLIFFLGVVLAMTVAGLLRSYLLTWIGERVIGDVRAAVFGRVLGLDMGFFESTRTGELNSRLTADTTLLQTLVGSTLAGALQTSIQALGALVMMALTSLPLTGLILLGTPLAALHLWLLANRLQRASRASQDRVADLGAYGDEVLHAIRTVQAFCHEPVDRARYRERVETAFRTATRRARVSAGVAALPTALTYGIIGVVLWFGGHEVLAGRMTGGVLTAFLYYALLLGSSAGGLYEIASDLIRGAGASERLMELLTAESGIGPPARPQSLPTPVRGRIEFQHLGFAYPSHPDLQVLKDLSLTIEPGAKVALVGPSGAGKSTTFQLLLRFYDPQQGGIRFDGVDLRDLDPRELRRHIAVVPQDPVIFGADAWENIRYGFESATDADVRRAADAAHATDFLDRLPEGFKTFLGERGVRLSGGQRQRLAIARAILRNPPLLLLDEATSALDAESERLVQLALEKLMANRTSIVIAHRLATVRKVDRILVFDQGTLVAQGTHEELLNQEGLYARLAALQFRGKEPDENQ